MKKIIFVLSIVCSALVLMAAEDSFNATVTASKLNVRIKPTIKAPSAGVLKKGDRIKVTKEDNSWVELEAPESLKLYVSEVYLVNGKLTNSVNLRTGRDAKAPSFGLLAAGTKLETLEENSRYGWIQVKAPAGIKVYAYKDYVAFDNAKKSEITEVEKTSEAEEKKTEEVKTAPAAEEKKVEEKKTEEVKAAPAAKETPAAEEVKAVEVKKAAPKAEEKKTEVVKAEEKKVEAAPKAAEKKAEVKKATVDAKKIEADLEALNAKLEKDSVVVKGILYAIPGSTTSLTNYAVLNGRENQGFVCGYEDAEFKKLIQKEVEFTGKSYRISGWKAPIVVVK